VTASARIGFTCAWNFTIKIIISINDHHIAADTIPAFCSGDNWFGSWKGQNYDERIFLMPASMAQGVS
jgi:hypothetical protein